MYIHTYGHGTGGPITHFILNSNIIIISKYTIIYKTINILNTGPSY